MTVTALAETWDYVLAGDRSRRLDARSVFTLRPMTIAERRVASVSQRVRESAIAIVVAHVVRVSNFPTDAPEPWPDHGQDRVAYLELLHDEHVYELAGEVIEHAFLDRDRPKLTALLYARAHVDLARRTAGDQVYSCAACALNPSMMDMLGHSAPPRNLYTSNLLTGDALTLCPVRTVQLAEETDSEIAAEIARFRNTYEPHYRNGYLLVGGGVTDQPARAMDLLALMDLIDAEAMKKHAQMLKET